MGGSSQLQVLIDPVGFGGGSSGSVESAGSRPGSGPVTLSSR